MSLTDYSNIEKEIRDVPEPIILPKGSEEKARIIAVRSGVSDKNGAAWYQPVFDVPAKPLAKEFNGFFWDLADRNKLEDKQAVNAMRDFKKFAECFGLDFSKPFSWEDDLIGLEGWVILGIKKSDEYGDQNIISSYVKK
jgi:hypothetical protein